MIDQGKYYLQQLNQSKVLAELNIGYLLYYVFYEVKISGKLFKADSLYSSERTRLMAIKILTKLHDLISKDNFNYDTYRGIRIYQVTNATTNQ